MARKAVNRRFMYRQTLDALERGELPDGEARGLLIRIGRALLNANPTDMIRTVADLGKPFRLTGDHQPATEFHQRYQRLHEGNLALSPKVIMRKVRGEMGISPETARRYRKHTTGMLRVERCILKGQGGGDS